MPLSERYGFGDFVLERSQARVRHRDGTPLTLTPRLFNALLLFVEHAGELLDKDALMLALWPGLVVEENNLSQVISALRRALGDEAPGSRYIQTVPRRGFRFIAPVAVLADVEAVRVEAPVDSQNPSPITATQPSLIPIAEVSATPEALAVPQLPARRRRTALAAGLATGIAAAAWWLWQRSPAADVMGQGQRPTLAVLPFKPLVAQGRDELLEVGMADSLIARLSTVPGLVVRSVGSVQRYAGPQQDPLRAARELDVTWIVDGSLQRSGEQLRATARLLRAADGTAAWSGSFDEKFTGVFDIQDLISTRVMQALAPVLQAVPGAANAAPRTAFTALTDVGGTRSTEAYELYLAASRHAQAVRADSLNKSLSLFNQALTVDSAYALAWVGLAESHRRRLFGADAVPLEVFEPSNLALRRALAVAPNLAQAHAGLGFNRYWYDFDWPGAERELRHALALNPNVTMAHFALAMMLLTQDRLDEGFVHMRQARELDPMSPLINTIEAGYLLSAGRLADARTRLARAFDIAPNIWIAHKAQGLLHLADGQTEAGISALRKAVALSDGSSQASSLLAVHLARQGQAEEARTVLSQLLALAQQRYVPPTSPAAVHAALGEVAPALGALERAYEARDTRLVFLKDDPRWTGLRKEPRFVALVQKLKLDRFGAGLSPP